MIKIQDHPLKGTSLVELIPKLRPDMASPHHLSAWCELIERAGRETVRALCAVPVRHWKTETTNVGIVRCLIEDPTIPVVHMSHSVSRAQELGKAIRELARHAGVGPSKGQDTILQWKNEHGGGVTMMSADQSRIGGNCGILFFDDPIDEWGAKSLQKRNEVDAAISLYTSRCHHRGRTGSVLGLMSRWHQDDPIGRRLLRKAASWEYVAHPAVETIVTPEGMGERRAFAPAVRSLEQLDQIRAELKEQDPNESIWWSQWMNDPRPSEAELFREPTYYEPDQLPQSGYRVAYGVDFSYTANDASDYSAFVHARVVGGRVFVVDSQLHRLDATLIEGTARRLLDTYGRAPIYSYQSGPEIGLSRQLNERGIPIAFLAARYNKLVRAGRTVQAWNRGQILLPRGAPWVEAFVQRTRAFSGRDGDGVDDEVDALVSLYDGSTGCAVGSLGVFGTRRY